MNIPDAQPIAYPNLRNFQRLAAIPRKHSYETDLACNHVQLELDRPDPWVVSDWKPPRAPHETGREWHTERTKGDKQSTLILSVDLSTLKETVELPAIRRADGNRIAAPVGISLLSGYAISSTNHYAFLGFMGYMDGSIEMKVSHIIEPKIYKESGHNLLEKLKLPDPHKLNQSIAKYGGYLLNYSQQDALLNIVEKEIADTTSPMV